MTTDKPPVILIRIKGHWKSEELARKTKKSWVDRGYNVEYFDAITPDNLDEYNYLDFGDEFLAHHRSYWLSHKKGKEIQFTSEINKWCALKRPNKKWYKRKITPTEKSVYYSHLEVYKLISKRKKPHIVIEHDIVLDKDLPSLKGLEFRAFSRSILWAYYITPFIADKILDFVNEYNLCLDLKHIRINEIKGSEQMMDCALGKLRLINADGFMYRVLTHILCSDPKNLSGKIGFRVFSSRKSKLLDSLRPPLDTLMEETPYVKDISEGVTTIQHIGNLVEVPKVAVLVNGGYPDYLDVEFLKENVDNILKIFHDCDIFWQCWDTPEQRKIMEESGVSEKIKIRWQQPKWGRSRYEPYDLVKREASDADATQYILNSKTVETPGILTRRKFATHQILQTCVQIKSINHINDYDFIIRTRWDVVLNKDIKISEFFDIAKKNVIGFCCGHEIFRFRDTQTYHSELRNARYSSFYWWHIEAKYRQFIVDQGFYAINSHEIDRKHLKGLSGEQRYHRWLNDPMIMFKLSDWTSKDVIDMWENGELYPAEYGFYQVLCEKRKHVNVQGLVSIKRMCDSTPQAWYKYQQVYSNPERSAQLRRWLKEYWDGDLNDVQRRFDKGEML